MRGRRPEARPLRREVDGDRGALVRRGVHRDEAVAVPHDAIHEREAQPGPCPTSFVVKNGSNRCACTSGAIPIPLSRTRRPTLLARHFRDRACATRGLNRLTNDLHLDAAAHGQGIARVDHQIQQHLFDLSGIEQATAGRDAV